MNFVFCVTPRHSCITVTLYGLFSNQPVCCQPVCCLFVLEAQLVSPRSETHVPSQEIPWHCLHCPWGFDVFDVVFCGICWFLSSEVFCLSQEKCCLDSAAIQRPVICGFMLFLFTWVAFGAILSLSQNEMETHSHALCLALGTSPRLPVLVSENEFSKSFPWISLGLLWLLTLHSAGGTVCRLAQGHSSMSG